jgi:hypothetical protein
LANFFVTPRIDTRGDVTRRVPVWVASMQIYGV